MTDALERLLYPAAQEPRRQVHEPQLGTVLSVSREGIRFMLDAFGAKFAFGPAPFSRGPHKPTAGDRIMVEFAGRGVGRPWVVGWWGDGEVDLVDTLRDQGPLAVVVLPRAVPPNLAAAAVLATTADLAAGVWHVQAQCDVTGAAAAAEMVLVAETATVDSITGAQSGGVILASADDVRRMTLDAFCTISDPGTLKIVAGATAIGVVTVVVGPVYHKTSGGYTAVNLKVG